MNFNLEDYEPVEERLARFHEQYPDGRVITEVVKYTDKLILVQAFLYRDYEDEKPYSTGIAEEVRGVGGPVNRTAHVENCETSAIGRALANAGYAPKGKRPSREEMEKVAKNDPENNVQFRDDDGKPLRNTDGHTACTSCGKIVSLRVEKFSLGRYKRVLCMKCQREVKE